MATKDYALGHGEVELRRLDSQAELLSAGTRALLREAGVTQGMTALDLGTGTGRVAMLLAELVGPGGHVVAVDSSTTALDYAARQAKAAGVGTIEFIEGDVAAPLPVPIADAAVGRLVLPYQDDPVSVLRTWATAVRPGGLVVAMEYDMSGGRSVPEVELVSRARDWIGAGFAAARQSQTLGPRLPTLFAAAGLADSRVLGAQAYYSPWDPGGVAMITGVVRSLLPLLVREGLATEDEVDVDTLQQRMHQEQQTADAVVCIPTLVACWARTGSESAIS
jgi:SAM-dependent methyltransferase